MKKKKGENDSSATTTTYDDMVLHQRTKQAFQSKDLSVAYSPCWSTLTAPFALQTHEPLVAAWLHFVNESKHEQEKYGRTTFQQQAAAFKKLGKPDSRVAESAGRRKKCEYQYDDSKDLIASNFAFLFTTRSSRQDTKGQEQWFPGSTRLSGGFLTVYCLLLLCLVQARLTEADFQPYPVSSTTFPAKRGRFRWCRGFCAPICDHDRHPRHFW